MGIIRVNIPFSKIITRLLSGSNLGFLIVQTQTCFINISLPSKTCWKDVDDDFFGHVNNVYLWSLLKSRKELFLLYSIAAQSLIMLPLSTSLLWSIWVKATTISSSGGEDRVCTYVCVPACFFFLWPHGLAHGKFPLQYTNDGCAPGGELQADFKAE